jgi:hypothetical protein
VIHDFLYLFLNVAAKNFPSLSLDPAISMEKCTMLAAFFAAKNAKRDEENIF